MVLNAVRAKMVARPEQYISAQMHIAPSRPARPRRRPCRPPRPTACRAAGPKAPKAGLARLRPTLHE